MNCEQAIATIDHYFDEELKQLPDEAKQHLAQCHGCSQYYIAGRKAETISSRIRHESFRLNDPETITNRIMNSIKDHPQQQDDSRDGYLVLFFQNNSLRKLIAAAAIILFAVFSYEQYIILDKVNHLEYQTFQRSEDLRWEMSAMKTYQQIRSIQSSIYAGMIQQDREKQKKKSGIIRLLINKNDADITKLIQADITWPARRPLPGSGH